MAASRVRVVFEFRNGDGHFLKRKEPKKWVSCGSEADVNAIQSAYENAWLEHVENLKICDQARQSRTS